MGQIIHYLKAVSDENRLAILKLVKPGNVCACELLEKLNVTQPTLSHHMRILVDSGLITQEKDGKWVRYTIDPSASDDMLMQIKNIF